MSDIIAEVLKRVRVAKGWVNEEQGSSRRNFFPQKLEIRIFSSDVA
jgi:hypothetical protein